MAEETILLNFQIDQGDALTQLQRTDKAILNLKEEQKELNKAYKEGTITQDQYVKENIKLTQALTKETDTRKTLTKVLNTESNSLDAQRLKLAALTKERNATNKSTAEGVKRSKELTAEIKHLNDEIKKQEQAGGDFRRNVGNYSDALKGAIPNIQIAGTSIGDLGTKLATFANPVTAAVGLLGALAGAYVSSSTGARDLAFAQDQLSAATSFATNVFGDFIDTLSGGGGQQGQGLLSSLVESFLTNVNASLAAVARVSAEAKRELRELELTQIDAQRLAKKALDEAEQLRRIRDAEDLDFETRLKAAADVELFINERQKQLVRVQEQRLEQLRLLLTFDKQSVELRKEIKQTELEIADILEDSQGKRTEARNAEIALEKEFAEAKRLAAADARARQRAQSGGPVGVGDTPELAAEFRSAPLILDIRKQLNKDLEKENARYAEVEKEGREKSLEIYKQTEAAKLDIAGSVLGSLGSLFRETSNEFKLIASAQALISTYEGAQKSYTSLSSIPVTGPALGAAAAAAAILAGLARVAQINNVQFADGGYTGPGRKYDPAGIVHKGEVVWSQKDVAMAGGPARVDAMRPTHPFSSIGNGYADGGIVRTAISSPINQQMEFMNAMKLMPPIEVSVKEITRVQDRVRTKQNISRL